MQRISRPRWQHREPLRVAQSENRCHGNSRPGFVVALLKAFKDNGGDMTSREAILSYSQSEKIKSVIIWISQILETFRECPSSENRSAETIIVPILEMIRHEVHISATLTGDHSWTDAEKHIGMAMTMIRSGIPHEGSFHLTRALTRITCVGNRAMMWLKEKSLL
jgi:hypothetical protein